MNKTQKQKRIRPLCAILLFCILLAAGLGIGIRESIQRHRAAQTPIFQTQLTIEAGVDLIPAAEQYVLEWKGWAGKTLQVTYNTPEELTDPCPPGRYPVTLWTEDEPETYSSLLIVQDTQPPVMVTRAVTIREGESYTAADFVESVNDLVDGSDCSVTLTDETTYTTPGQYTVTLSAQDQTGNTATVTAELTVQEKPVISTVTSTTSKATGATSNSQATVSSALATSKAASMPYLIRINRAANCVTVYQADENGDYDTPVKAMVCSTGDATPLGVFTTSDKYTWRALQGNVYGQYATRITGHILFHSVPYYSQNKSDLEYEEYNKLGQAASLGCIRLACIDAKWIYDNCPKGTTVEIYDDAENPGPLGKPEGIYLDLTSPNRGWDPTDPDPNNPW